MKYSRNYKISPKTHYVKRIPKRTQDVKSFNIPGEKYEDTRRVTTRKFIKFLD